MTQILDSYYYPGKNQVKLIVKTKKVAAGTPCRLTSENLLDTNGKAADCNETVYLFSEKESVYDAVAVSAVAYLRGNTPVKNTAGQSGIRIVVRINNSTKDSKQGTVTVYDGAELVASAVYSADAESFTEILLDVSEHTFKNQATINIQ